MNLQEYYYNSIDKRVLSYKEKPFNKSSIIHFSPKDFIHPQLFIFPAIKSEPLITFSLPHSHLQFQVAFLFLSLPALLRTVILPNF